VVQVSAYCWVFFNITGLCPIEELSVQNYKITESLVYENYICYDEKTTIKAKFNLLSVKNGQCSWVCLKLLTKTRYLTKYFHYAVVIYYTFKNILAVINTFILGAFSKCER
jgi:hypothetical protein